MRYRDSTWSALAAAPVMLGGAAAGAADKPPLDKEALDQALAALRTYDWGSDRETVKAIDDAIVATSGNVAARKDLETRLADLLTADVPRGARDYIFRKLMIIGSAQSVPTLEYYLFVEDLAHMARYALERLPAPEAVQVMREQVTRFKGATKVGVIGSLGVRRDAASVPTLAAMLGDADKTVVRAALGALGKIGTPEAAKALTEFAKKAPDDLKLIAADASLVCAEQLLADGKKTEATLLYKSLSGEDQPKNIRLAAMQGLLSVAGKRD
jgi:HEAT repeat protein